MGEEPVLCGRGQIVWNGRTYEVDAPEVIDQATASPSFSGSQRAAVERIGLGSFMRVRIEKGSSRG